MDLTIVIIYGFFLLFIFLYSLVQLRLALNYRSIKNSRTKFISHEVAKWPKVTIQLPVYNEKYVIERLIESVCSLDYPKNLLEIQVLDDGNDDSVDIAARIITVKQKNGFLISHIRRTDRSGFKAGALQFGLQTASGEFIAIFDADFIPETNFLKQTLPFLIQQRKIGVVQTRWLHLNRNYSLLTRLQAFGLDAHFTVEQVGRNSADHFINFNGTAGVWRKETIIDAGGWQSDTLTEDLDLSYRAQMKGWKFLYLKEIGSPAELPVDMNALKNQQFRWTKGAAECAKKNLPAVINKSDIEFSHKVHAIFHLMNSFLFVCILITSLLSIPILFIKDSHPEWGLLFKLASIFMISFLILGFFYWQSAKDDQKGYKWYRFIVDFLMFLSVSMGLSLHNSLAVIEGYSGIKSPFIRTPKFALQGLSGSWKNHNYRSVKISALTIVEVLLFFYFLSGIVLAFFLDDYGLIPFHVMLATGYFIVSWFSVKHART